MKSSVFATVLFCCLALLTLPVRADAPNPLATQILKIVDRPVGLVHLPRCGDGALAIALATADAGLAVHGQDASAAGVNQARAAADKAGMLGRRIWIDQAGLERLLPAGRSCDLIVMDDLAGKDLTPQLAAEIRRVLHPWYGVAILGDSSGRLDAQAIAKWAGAIAVDVKACPGLAGFVMVKAGALDKSDDWTHWWHGPDNNAVSTDAVYSVPETLQWTGKPYFAPTRIELPIISGGRLFMLWNGCVLDMAAGRPALSGDVINGPVPATQPAIPGTASHPGFPKTGPLLTAQTVGSGMRLWVRRLSPAAWLQVARSVMVADGACLLVADGPNILELDAATGKELRRVEIDCGEVRWMAVCDGQLIVLGGAMTEFMGTRMDTLVVPYRAGGLLLTVLHRDTLKEVWNVKRAAGPEAFDPCTPAISGGKMFVCTEGGEAQAFALGDGQPLWHTATGLVHGKVQLYDWDRISRHPVGGFAEQGLYFVCGLSQDPVAAFAQADGRKLWSLPRSGAYPLGVKDVLWTGGVGLDPQTGLVKVKAGNGNLEAGGCSRFTASPQGLIAAGGLTWDWLANKPYPLVAKSACGPGQIVADGQIWKFSVPCSCGEWRGLITRSAVETLPAPPARLVAGESKAASAAAPTGWLSYRADAARSGSIALSVGTAAKIAWATPPTQPAGLSSQVGTVLFDPEMVPVPPVIAGNLAVVAGADGAVEALNLSDGQRQWRARTGGRIASSPTIWKDRVLVGSSDGCLYAFALTDGKEMWHLRVAPDAARVMVFGQLASRWPVLASPLVVEDRVYISAGFMDGVDGVYRVAADAATGRILWEGRQWPAVDAGFTVSGAGQWCWDGTGAVYHGGLMPPLRSAIADGTAQTLLRLPTAEETRKRKVLTGPHEMTGGVAGQDVGAFGSDWLVYGGRRLFSDEAERTTSLAGPIAFLPLHRPDGWPLIRVTDAFQLPAWDQHDALFLVKVLAKNKMYLILIPRPKLEAALADLANAADHTTAAATGGAAVALKQLTLTEGDLVQWRLEVPYGEYMMQGWTDCALTENAALLLTGDKKLTAVSRTEGKRIWTLPLPAPPVHGGMAVAPDGRIIVALCDGTVVGVGTSTP